MILVGNSIVSEDLLDKCFVCDLEKCKGLCCVEGDAGAPLTEEESTVLQTIFPVVKDYLPSRNINTIKKQGVFVKDFEGELTTPLVDGKHCVYAFFDGDGVAKCVIEKAFRDGSVDFQKPVSCHLYPVRISTINEYEALNYHEWPICDEARVCGQKSGIPVYRFVKDALIRKYGKIWFDELVNVAEAWEVNSGR